MFVGRVSERLADIPHSVSIRWFDLRPTYGEKAVSLDYRGLRDATNSYLSARRTFADVKVVAGNYSDFVLVLRLDEVEGRDDGAGNTTYTVTVSVRMSDWYDAALAAYRGTGRAYDHWTAPAGPVVSTALALALNEVLEEIEADWSNGRFDGYPKPVAEATLVQCLPALAGVLDAGTAAERMEAAADLAAIAETARIECPPSVRESLLRGLSDPVLTVRFAFVLAAGRLARAEPSLVDALLSLVQSPAGTQSAYAALALGEAGEAARSAMVALSNPNLTIRELISIEETTPIQEEELRIMAPVWGLPTAETNRGPSGGFLSYSVFAHEAIDDEQVVWEAPPLAQLRDRYGAVVRIIRNQSYKKVVGEKGAFGWHVTRRMHIDLEFELPAGTIALARVGD